MIEFATYQARRAQFIAQMSCHSVAVFPANTEARRSRDTEYTFRQDSDFWYLSGFNEPDAWLVLTKAADGTSQQIVFCRPKDKTAEIWQGRRYGPELAKSTFLFDDAYALPEFNEKISGLLDGVNAIYWPIGEYAAADETLYSVMNTLRQQAKLHKAPKQMLDSRDILHEMRLFKSPEELAVMRHIGNISCHAHQRAMQFCQPDVFEYQLEAEILHEFAMNGARSAAYNTIVAGGDNANILHYTDNQDQLKSGDLVLIDAGGEFDGYAADITRTFPVSGQFSPAQKTLYQLVLDAQTESMKLIKPGSTLKLATDKAIEVICCGLVELGIITGSVADAIEHKTYRDYFMHGLGHWLGLDVHDVGDYKKQDTERPFENGMVLTVEPGLYISLDADVDPQWRGIGIRIEDNVVITDSGFENLTQNAPKTIEAIEALMAKKN
ncbi:Xaa-Pro aminopeptidase [Algibacillus agarilyticus]|uniref:Xaa-Pro aminopeptidase n=1 Tax=Algibacillus agarilyticus TaxID=2234133 RepID=UPI000DD04119|nr:Xaa-Pro aminopeptidase [Algibacillus agarilyticus]